MFWFITSIIAAILLVLAMISIVPLYFIYRNESEYVQIKSIKRYIILVLFTSLVYDRVYDKYMVSDCIYLSSYNKMIEDIGLHEVKYFHMVDGKITNLECKSVLDMKKLSKYSIDK